MDPVTQSLLDRNAHIPSNEVRQDIRDTEQEIADLTREEQGYRMIGDKMSIFRADARATGIRERQAFIVQLKMLLSARGEQF